MKKHISMRFASMLLILALFVGLIAPANAINPADNGAKLSVTQVDNSEVSATPLSRQLEEPTEPGYADTDIVRVSIIGKPASTIAAGFSSDGIAQNEQAVAYRANLEKEQRSIQAKIERATGTSLDVVWNLTLAANIISANVPYGQISTIEQIPGVQKVYLETRYDPATVTAEEPDHPNTSTSSSMIGVAPAYAAGYTGAGTRIAVIDTGIDTDHQSFDAGAFDYSLAQQASNADKAVSDYNLLDADQISEVLSQLHISGQVSAEQLYVSTKIPFGYNYVDKDTDITHDNDRQGEHGSHVEGIAAANAYIPNGDGTYAEALSSVHAQGVAPDAQIIAMKVFGKKGGAYESDYLAAIEDAIVLGCDSVNLSLGSSNPGNSTNSEPYYQRILDSLSSSGVVVTMSIGNAGAWPTEAFNLGYLYSDDVSMLTAGSPGTYTNSLSVASVDNAGYTGPYFTVGDHSIFYTEGTTYRNQPLSTLAGEQTYILIDGLGTAQDWAAVGDALKGAVAVCSRGTLEFAEKATQAVAAGAIATIIYNNEPGSIHMDLSNYKRTEPVVSITQEERALLQANATPVTDEAGNVLYYQGTLFVEEGVDSTIYDNKYNTMSSFSSWGVPGSLEMKPEITAPGGNIYSVDGSVAGGTAYESMSGTSMASPQVAGMAALVAQYIREENLTEKTGLTPRTLAQSLLMSTAVPMLEDHGDGTDGYYSILQQGAGLANVGKAIAADSFILMKANATKSYADGKVKVELGDDPERKGTYTFSFSLYNLTAAEKTYDLSADFFTQDVFTDSVNLDQDQGDYMDTRTTPLDMTVTFDTGSRVTVPANGSATVTVTATLKDSARTTLSEKYPCGAYVEGFVYAKGATTPEGVEGTEHSIPVLGFYGGWTESSMFDVGCYAEYQSNMEKRTSYVGYTYTNCLGVTYAAHAADGAYSYGGNPVVADESYMPDRNAINNQNGDVLAGISFTSIRNAVGAKFEVHNLTQDKLTYSLGFSAISSAFFYELGGTWMNYGITRYFPRPCVPAGNEGDKILATMTLAPEYYASYVGEDLYINWDALGEGATLSVPMVIDNTAPELVGNNAVSNSGNTLTVTAKDNQYIAGVALYNSSGATRLAVTGSKAEILPGETAQYTLDLTNINGTRFLLQVYDYAMNTTTYVIDQQIGDPTALPAMIGFNVLRQYWVSLTTTSTYENAQTSYAESDGKFLASTMVDSYIFGATSTGSLYVMPASNLTDTTLVADLDTLLYDMTYNEADGQIYAVDQNSNLVTVDKLTGAVQVVGRIGNDNFTTNTLACDKDGTFYCNQYDTAYVCKFTLDTMDAPEQVACVWSTPENFSSFSAQSMEVDPNTGHLIWTSYEYIWVYGGQFRWLYYYLFEISPENDYAVRQHNDLRNEITSLIIPDKSGTSGGSWAAPTDSVSKVQISRPDLTLWKGNSGSLYATVSPWTATNRDVTWTSSDETVATVNSNGTVTAVGVGTCQITATSKLDPNYSDSCEVTVNAVPVTLHGVLQDQDGNPMLFTWDLEHDDTWEAGTPLDTEFVSTAYDSIEDKLYVMDSDSTMHKINPSTGKTEASAASETPLWDMQSSLCYSSTGSPKLTGVYDSFIYACKDPMSFNVTPRFNASSNLSGWGANCFVASASLGHVLYHTSDGLDVDTERFVLLDNIGGLWNLYLYWDEGEQEYLALITIRYTSNLREKFPGYDSYKFCSMVGDSTGALYLSAFDGSTSKLYRLDIDDARQTANASYLGTMGSDIWPASLYFVQVHGDCQHKNTEIRNAKDATCTEDGYTGDTYCTDCNERIARGAIIAATGHTMGEWTVSEPVTCLKNGIEIRKCRDCDYEETRVIEATGHDFTESTVSPTCTSDGYTQHTCTKCGHNYREDFTPALGHSYEETRVSATCTEAGYTIHTCVRENCDHSYIDSILPALGHSYRKEVQAPTHDKMGYTTYTCTHEGCGHSYVSDYTDALGHTYTQTVTKEATCTEEGVMTFTCDCGESYTQPIPKAEHQYHSVVTEPDCTHMGYTTHTCTVCGNSYQDSFVDATGHDCEATVVAPTCTGYGYTEHACKHCDYHYTSDMQQPLGHVGQLQCALKATCTSDGYTGDTVCTVCSETLQVGQIIPATGHSFGEWTVTQQPDCFHDGHRTHTCTTCEETETEILEKNSELCPSKAFTDLDCSKWYHEGVDFALTSGLMEGMGNGIFSPDSHMTRGQLVTVLYRLADEPQVQGDAPFTDVAESDYYAKAVAWAYTNHIAIGVGDTRFAPNAPVTREQMVTFLARYAKLAGKEISATEDLSSFTDGSSVSPFAAESMAWAVETGLVEGMGNHTLSPKSATTRAQAATIFMRYFEILS